MQLSLTSPGLCFHWGAGGQVPRPAGGAQWDSGMAVGYGGLLGSGNCCAVQPGGAVQKMDGRALVQPKRSSGTWQGR